MAARSGADENQAIDACFERFFGVTHVDHVVQHDPAVRVNVRNDVVRRPKTGDRDRHFVPDADLDVMLEPVVRLVHDLVDREWRCIRMPRERALDLAQPVIERFLRARVERGK